MIDELRQVGWELLITGISTILHREYYSQQKSGTDAEEKINIVR